MRSNFAPVLVLAAAGLLLLPCVVFVAARLALPGDDTQVVLDFSRAGAEGLMVKPLEPGSVGLRAGDVVVSVEDRSVEAWLAAEDFRRGYRGQRAQVPTQEAVLGTFDLADGPHSRRSLR